MINPNPEFFGNPVFWPFLVGDRLRYHHPDRENVCGCFHYAVWSKTHRHWWVVIKTDSGEWLKDHSAYFTQIDGVRVFWVHSQTAPSINLWPYLKANKLWVCSYDYYEILNELQRLGHPDLQWGDEEWYLLPEQAERWDEYVNLNLWLALS